MGFAIEELEQLNFKFIAVKVFEFYILYFYIYNTQCYKFFYVG